MEIFINEIPEEGLHRSGEFPPSLFDLPKEDPIRATGPVRYVVDMYRFEDGIAFAGHLTGHFQLQCASCLEFVDYEADFPNWSSDLELKEDQRSFDLAQVIREDFLLDLPASPRCDELVPNRTCPKAAFFEKAAEEAVEEPEEKGNPDLWKALDDLD